MNKSQLRQLVKKYQSSTSSFVESCCKIKHTTIGVLPFKLFKYQRSSIVNFRRNRFVIFRKCRQSGVSTLSGAYALWMAMFFNHKTILIVSKRDTDAKEFLERNVKFVYRHLPEWMQNIWETPIWREHEIGFSNGSKITSLTSSPDTLRSNSASLNIIDEAAFMPDMERMWGAGYSTLQHGGSVIVISTPNGVGNWYWDKCTEAEANDGIFKLIRIRWWDMDWVLEYRDPLSGNTIRIAPTDNIRECTTKEELEKWGEYWSPWLEQQYLALQARGEAHLFRQEVLGEFIGSGSTVISVPAIMKATKQVQESDNPVTIIDPVQHINQATGEQSWIEFTGETKEEGLWIWEKPHQAEQNQYKNGRIIAKGDPGHSYVIGVDVATGENNDYSAAEIIDLTTMAQVAEYMGHVEIKQFAKIVDWLGRYYNHALVNIERTGIGVPFIQDINELIYPNLWRPKKQTAAGMRLGPPGFATTGQSKPTINKALVEYINENDNQGVRLRSHRLLRQLQIYIRKRNNKGIATKRTGAQEGRGNHDDLVIAAGLAFIAAPDVVEFDPTTMIPFKSTQNLATAQVDQSHIDREATQKKLWDSTDTGLLMPLTFNQVIDHEATTRSILEQFTKQLIPNKPTVDVVRHPKRYY